MDCCYRYLRFHVKFNTWMAIPFFVKRDFFRKSQSYIIFSYIHQYLSVIVQILGAISGVIIVPYISHDMNVLCGCLSGTVHSIQVVVKTSVLQIQSNRYLEQMKIFARILENNDSLRQMAGMERDFQTYHFRVSRYVRVLESIYVFIQVMMTVLYFAPFLANAIIYHDRIENQNLPIVGYIPFDYNVTPVFQLVAIFQAICYYYYNAKTAVLDSFMLGLVVLLTTHFRYLNKIMEAFVEKMNPDKSSFKEEAFLRAWIIQHDESLKMLKAFRSLISHYILLQFAYLFVNTCVPAFVITSTVAWDMAQKTALVLMLSGGILVVYLMSAAGDKLSVSNENAVTAFYGPHLFRENSLFHQTFQKMLTMRTRIQPASFSFLIFPLCSVSFGNLMRTVTTYYMALNEIQQLKNQG